MEMIIRGQTACAICGDVLEAEHEIEAFPSFTENPRDPLYAFNEAVIHRACFDAHPMADAAARRRRHFIKHRLATVRRICKVCDGIIDGSEEAISIGHLTANRDQPAFRYNYAQFHESHLRSWPDLHLLLEAVVDLQRSDEWDHEDLQPLIDLLDSYL